MPLRERVALMGINWFHWFAQKIGLRKEESNIVPFARNRRLLFRPVKKALAATKAIPRFFARMESRIPESWKAVEPDEGEAELSELARSANFRELEQRYDEERRELGLAEIKDSEIEALNSRINRAIDPKLRLVRRNVTLKKERKELARDVESRRVQAEVILLASDLAAQKALEHAGVDSEAARFNVMQAARDFAHRINANRERGAGSVDSHAEDLLAGANDFMSGAQAERFHLAFGIHFPHLLCRLKLY